MAAHMLIQYLLGLRSRRILVRETFQRSQASYLEFLDVAEPCALRVSQDYKLAWQNVFKLQRLLKKREDMRFAHLLQACNLDCSLFETLDDLAVRLEAGWSQAEEIAMQECNAHYREISQKIGDIRSKWDPHAVGESTRTLEQDPKYLAARLALADRAKKFAERIQR
jgi:hypothetical protein